jgi:hypothetical protein
VASIEIKLRVRRAILFALAMVTVALVGAPAALAAAPTVTDVNPGHGPAAGGNSVTISGTDFGSATEVDFGSVTAAFAIVDGNTITATAPGGTGGSTVNVTVTNSDGTSPADASGVYSYDVPPPAITRLTPNHGSAGGGYQVTITGTDFGNASSVKFGNANATGLTVLSDSTITVNAPSGTAGSTVKVKVMTSHGTSDPTDSANDFSYDPVLPPTITALSPAGGPAAGGNQVTITGTGFAGATSVKFGTVKAAFLVLNNGTITATAPPGTGKVDVTVTTAVGTNPTSGAGNDYSYDPVLLAAGPRTPNTIIGRHPHHRIHKRKVAFTFSSDISGVSFQCLYADGWKKCHSPLTFRHLSPGRYRFKVKAVVNGVADPTPATFTFRVRR